MKNLFDVRRGRPFLLCLLLARVVGADAFSLARAAVPTLNFQGRISTDRIPAEGQGRFKFALLDATGNVVWVHAADLDPADGEPDSALTLPLHHGHFAVELGEGMIPLPTLSEASLANLRLRIWFGETDRTLHRLQPDTPLVGLPLANHSVVAAESQTMTGPVSVLQIAGSLPSSAFPTNIAWLDSSPSFSGPVTAPQFVGAGVEGWIRTEDMEVLTRPNRGYLVGGDAGPVTVRLPADARVGDVVRVRGVTSAGWSIAESDGTTLELPAGYFWRGTGPVEDWVSVASSADGQRLLAAPDFGRIHLSTDGGVTWEPRGIRIGWGVVGCSADGQVMVAGQRSGTLWRSVDGGETWQSLGVEGEWLSLTASHDGSRWLAASRTGALKSSQDYGAHWTALLRPGGSGRGISGGPWRSVASSADGRKLIAAEEGGRVWTSTDAGVNWIPRLQPDVWGKVASSADGTRLVVMERPVALIQGLGPQDCLGHHLWISTDSGETWNLAGPPGCYGTVGTSADGLRILAYRYGGQLDLSEDGGRSWDSRAQPFEPIDLTASADGRRWVAGSSSSMLYYSLPEARGGEGSDMAWQCLGEGRWRGVALSSLTPDGTLALDKLGTIDASRISSGTLDLDRLPLLQIFDFASGVFSPAQVPSRLTRSHVFPDGVQIGGTHLEAAPLSVGRDQANARFGYALSLHDRDGTAWWKLGADDQARFSIGAAGLRDDDVSVDRGTGNVGLGTTPTTSARLTVAGSVATTGAAEFGGSVRAKAALVISDARRKTRIALVENALPTLERLRGVQFAWRSAENPDAPDLAAGLQTGFLAQEVAAVLPEAVKTNANGFLRLDYQALTPVLVEALKQLQQQLHARLVATDAHLAELESGIAQLETQRAAALSSRP